MASRLKRLKILHVVGAFPIPPLGGMEAVAYYLPVELAKLGHEVQVLSGSSEPKRALVGGAEFRGIRSFHLSNWARTPSWASYRELKRAVEWADVVHLHNPPEVIPLLAGRYGVRLGRTLVCSVLSPHTLRSHPRLLFRAVGAIDEMLVFALLRRASMVQVKNALDEAEMRQLTDRVTYIPDGIESIFFETPLAGTSWLDEQGFSGRSPVLLYVGRIHPLKGIYDLLETTKALETSHPQALTLIVGSGPEDELARLRGAIRDQGLEGKVVYVGPVSPEEKVRLIDSANVVLVPSKADFVEGFSIICSEAWSRGKPVAAYPVGALRVRVRDGSNGFLAGEVSSRALGTAVEKALALKFGNVPADVMDWPGVAQKFEALYQALESGAPPPGTRKETDPGPMNRSGVSL